MDDREQKREGEREKTAVFETTRMLYVRHVEERGLPASVVLPELSEDRGSQGPVPIFVP